MTLAAPGKSINCLIYLSFFFISILCISYVYIYIRSLLLFLWSLIISDDCHQVQEPC